MGLDAPDYNGPEIMDGYESFDVADDSNVPVNIFLEEGENDETGEKTGYWELTADLFMPRKGFQDSFFGIRSQDKAELQAIVKEKIIPLYQRALVHLHGMADGSLDSLYYWK